ncbi:MAG: 4Fe-4S dicluster domain-containing protein [Bacteroidales bacterium]|nr:4Fe-4S dicluster domain-containing protein [Bacteroidales bacterium]
MDHLFEELEKDYRFKEGYHTCINCGTCTAVCPAAEFYRYDPRKIVSIVQTRDDAQIEALLRCDTIWYCGECMSCVTRCPRKNGPGMVIMALRDLSIRLGYFTESEKGRQMLPLTHTFTRNILEYGYCVYPATFDWNDHKESGPVWKWHMDHLEKSLARLGVNYQGEGPGVLRKIPQESLDELKAIFDVTGATERIRLVEDYSRRKAEEMGLSLEEYERTAFEYSSDKHFNE